MKTKVLVIGGSGFVGERLCSRLSESVDKLYEVYVFDMSKSHSVGEYWNGDITSNEDISNCFAKIIPDVVVHLASYGMSGSAMLSSKCDVVNVLGTKIVVDACIQFGVKSLIYTSTYNVVFGGQEINNGCENLNYFPLEKHVDKYGPSKARAEKIVLSANGTTRTDGSILYTCSLRPAAIYGNGEQRHFPRIIAHINR